MIRRTLLLFLAAAAFLGAEELRVATLNLQNYLVQDRRVEGVWRRDYPKPEKEKAALRKAIAAIDPDILALQEMGPAPFLRQFQEELAAAGTRFPHAVHFRAEDENRHLSVLSKIKPAEVLRHTDMDFPYFGERLRIKRGLLEVVFPVPGAPERRWSLFVVHLKSRWSDQEGDPESNERRRKEARAARNRILERYPDAEGLFLVAGDFNDHRESAPLRRFLRRADIDISRIVETYDSRREKWTYYYDDHDRYERVDFILASREMFRRIPGGRGTIFDALFVREGSDHRPVYVDLRFGQGDGVTGSAGSGRGFMPRFSAVMPRSGRRYRGINPLPRFPEMSPHFRLHPQGDTPRALD